MQLWSSFMSRLLIPSDKNVYGTFDNLEINCKYKRNLTHYYSWDSNTNLDDFHVKLLYSYNFLKGKKLMNYSLSAKTGL